MFLILTYTEISVGLKSVQSFEYWEKNDQQPLPKINFNTPQLSIISCLLYHINCLFLVDLIMNIKNLNAWKILMIEATFINYYPS